MYIILCERKNGVFMTSLLSLGKISIYYIGKFEGGFAIFDSIRLKLGVSETIPGK